MILLLSVSAEQEKTETVRYFCLYGYNVRMRITSIKQECAGCCILAQANGDILHMHIKQSFLGYTEIGRTEKIRENNIVEGDLSQISSCGQQITVIVM